MSEPRIIPADQARELRESITPGRWKLNERESVVGIKIDYWDESPMEIANVKLAEASPDLAFTVEQQDKVIAQQAAQIARLQRAVREAIHYTYDSVDELVASHILTEGDMADE